METKKDNIMLEGDVRSCHKVSFKFGEPITPVGQTIETPEPPFEEIESLISDKPLRFYRSQRLEQ